MLAEQALKCYDLAVAIQQKYYVFHQARLRWVGVHAKTIFDRPNYPYHRLIHIRAFLSRIPKQCLSCNAIRIRRRRQW